MAGLWEDGCGKRWLGLRAGGGHDTHQLAKLGAAQLVGGFGLAQRIERRLAPLVRHGRGSEAQAEGEDAPRPAAAAAAAATTAAAAASSRGGESFGQFPRDDEQLGARALQNDALRRAACRLRVVGARACRLGTGERWRQSRLVSFAESDDVADGKAMERQRWRRAVRTGRRTLRQLNDGLAVEIAAQSARLKLPQQEALGGQTSARPSLHLLADYHLLGAPLSGE